MKEPLENPGKYKIVLLARNTESTWMIYNYLRENHSFALVIMEEGISRFTLFKNRVKRIGWFRSLGQLFFILGIAPVISFFSKNRKKEILLEHKLNLQKTAIENFRLVSSVNSESCRQLLQEVKPDLVIINGTRIISPKTLSCIPSSFINIHDGITPAFRGVHGGYWAMALGMPQFFGTTIHYVDPGIDTGGIIRQVFAKPDRRDNFSTYPFLQHAIAMPVLNEIVQEFRKGSKPEVQNPVCANAPLRFHPTVWEWIKYFRRTR